MLHQFLDGEAHEINEIAETIGVSRQTVMKCINFYQRNGLVISAGKGASGAAGGKKPLLYTLTPDRFLVCVTLWDRAFIINLFNMNGVLIDQISLDTPLPESLESAAENIIRLSDVLMKKNNVDVQHVRGVSVSLPGIVDRKINTLIFSAGAPGWGMNIPLTDYLRPFFPEETLFFLQSSTKMISCNYLTDPGLVKKRLLTITVSEGGVSGCLIENGHILNGTNSLIGEIGHMLVAPGEGEVCSCGKRGCLNARLAPARLRRIIRHERERNPASVLLSDEEELPYNTIFRAAQEGDPLAEYCTGLITDDLSVTLHNISVVYDPDYVIFVGKGFIGNELVSRKIFDSLGEFRYFANQHRPFEIVYDDCDLVERDAKGAMLTLRWILLNDEKRYWDSEDDNNM